MKKLLFLLIILPNLFYSQWTQKGLDIDGEAAYDHSGTSVALSNNGNIVAIGTMDNDGNGNNSGHVRVFAWVGSAWYQLGQDIDGEAPDDISGFSVSLSSNGNKVAIGAYLNDGNGSDAGHVRIYNYNGTSWNQLGQDIDGEATLDGNGYSVSLSSGGDTIAIGAKWNDGNGSDAGHVRIYNYNGSSWNQLGQDIDGEAPDDASGCSVSINSNGSIVAIGANKNDAIGMNSGHVRIYEYTGVSWNQLGLDIDGEAVDDWSGESVAINSSGDIVAIGAYKNDGNGFNSGHVRIYAFDGTNWNQLGQDIDGEYAVDASGQKEGLSLSSDGHTVAIGAKDNDGNGNKSGHVRIFNWDGNSWNQVGSDLDGEYAADLSGHSVSLSSDGNTVAIGAPYNDGTIPDTLPNRGHVRIYIGCPTTTGSDTQTACDSYTWIDGNTYTSSNNTATDTLTNMAGCDSVVTLNLTINTVDNGITNSSPTLTATATIASYQWLDCDNSYALIAGETNQNFTATINGNYAVVVTQNGCTDTSACEMVNNVGIDKINSNIKIHPNPTNDLIALEIEGYNGPFEVEIYDLQGRLLETTKSRTVSLKKYSKGLYVFRVSYGDITKEVRVVRD